MTAARPGRDLLDLLRQGFLPAAPTDTVDADVPLDLVVGWLATRPGGPAALAARLAEVVERHDRGVEDAQASLGLPGPVPAGGSWREWTGYALTRVAVAAHRTGGVAAPPPSSADELLLPPRASRFTDPQCAAAAVEQTLAASRARVGAWIAAPDRPARLVLAADLGRPLGRVLEASRGRLPRSGVGTSCVVVLRRAGAAGYDVVSAYPDLAPAQELRLRFADLVGVFGGYFGQHWRELSEHSPWLAERALNEDLPTQRRVGVVDALDELLTLDDPELAEAVDALGSYLRPVRLRRWVLGLRRRMVDLDWTPARAAGAGTR